MPARCYPSLIEPSRHSRNSGLQTGRPNQAESPEITHAETHGAKAEIRPRPFRSPVPPNIFWSASRNVVFPMRTLMKGAVMAAGAFARRVVQSGQLASGPANAALLALAGIGCQRAPSGRDRQKHSVSGAETTLAGYSGIPAVYHVRPESSPSEKVGYCRVADLAMLLAVVTRPQSACCVTRSITSNTEFSNSGVTAIVSACP